MVLSSNRTPYFSIAKINLLILFKEIISLYSENYTKSRNKNGGLLIVKADRRNPTIKGHII
jgi:hypothetical protein